MLKLAYGVLLAFFGAILVHIAIVFLIPRLNEPRVLTQLQSLNQTRDPLMFSGAEDKIAFPGIDPLFRYRICFYNLEDGPFQLVSSGDVAFFSAALVSFNGDVLFSITDRQTINRTLNIDVRPASEQQRLSQNQAGDATVDGAVPVFVPASEGYAIVRAFVPDKSWEEITDNFLNDIVCQSG